MRGGMSTRRSGGRRELGTSVGVPRAWWSGKIRSICMSGRDGKSPHRNDTTIDKELSVDICLVFLPLRSAVFPYAKHRLIPERRRTNTRGHALAPAWHIARFASRVSIATPLHHPSI